MRVIDIERINQKMRDEVRFIMECEEVYHNNINKAAVEILAQMDTKRFVALTGPSGSGKTTTAMRLKAYIENLGVEVISLSMDNFFISFDELPPEADDFESPYCVDANLLFESIESLSLGKKVSVPWYDFKTSKRGGYRDVQGSRNAIIIIEGIHMLNPLIFDKIRDKSVGMYIAPRTRIITNDDRIVKPEQIRVARRLIRDYNTRGNSLQKTVLRAETVNNGEKRHIAPYKHNASIHIDTFHDYEPCILAKYLKEIPEFHEELTPEFMEEHGLTALMTVVNSIKPLTTNFVPKDSLIREFVGGSKFEY